MFFRIFRLPNNHNPTVLPETGRGKHTNTDKHSAQGVTSGVIKG